MYGITEKDIKVIDKKIDFQKEYIKKFVSNFEEDNSDFLKSVYSASLNPKKYFAEINNRVNTLVNNAKDKGYKPVFITLTLPSYYHRKDNKGNLIISPNLSSKVLSHLWAKFLRLKIFEHLKEDFGESMQYFRVYEPHKSGVPHLHALLFLPDQYILKVKKRFYSYFMDLNTWGKIKDTDKDIGALNIKGLGFRYTWYKEKGGAIGYVMKYILKTFKDEKKEDIQHAVYWYVKHRVIRFLSSRTLVPLSIYRKVRYYFKENFGIYSLKEITRLFRQGFINRYFNDTLITYSYFNPDSDEYCDIILWEKDPELQLNKRFNSSKDIAFDLVNKRKQLQAKKDIIEFDNQLLNKIVPVKYRTTLQIVEDIKILISNPDFDKNAYALLNNELLYRQFKYFDKESMSIKCDELIKISDYDLDNCPF